MTSDIVLEARPSDPDTSHAAMARVSNMQSASDCVVALYKQHGPMADYELSTRFAAQWPQDCCDHLYRQARSVARDQGLIRDSGQRIVNPATNRHQIVWEHCSLPAPKIALCHACGHVLRRVA